jgi:hypothetical protein
MLPISVGVKNEKALSASGEGLSLRRVVSGQLVRINAGT